MSERIPKKEKFRVGQRVRPSKYGQENCIFPRTRFEQTGVVVRLNDFAFPAVLWEGRKTVTTYWAGFITADRRRRK